MAYPKMLYSEDYKNHLHPTHDHDVAAQRARHTCVVQNPDDHAIKAAQGWRESYADDFDDVSIEPSEPLIEVAPEAPRSTEPVVLET